MRRLIDVDELIKYFDEDLEGYDNREYILQMLDTKGRIERVETIPVEWIKNYARHKASKGFTEIDCYWQYWEEDVLKMVTEWEKENDD